ncbi:hypothetical protein BDR06DRAFT_969424 [Suillus hirtellus]|nr:hypothetical protein BDR06DRAFT_969424 [Suillus hirtellus]
MVFYAYVKQHVNTQFYTYNVNVANSTNSLITTGVVTQFLGKVFFNLLNDLDGHGLSIIPWLKHFMDHISGNFCTDSGTAGTIIIESDSVIITLTTVYLSINVNATTGQVILSLVPLWELTFSTLLTYFTIGPSLSVDDDTMKELLYMEKEWEAASLPTYNNSIQSCLFTDSWMILNLNGSIKLLVGNDMSI